MMKKKTSFKLYQGLLAQSDSTQWMYWVPFYLSSPVVLEVDDVQKDQLRRKHMGYNSIASFFSVFLPLLCLELFTLPLYLVIPLIVISIFLHDLVLKWTLKKELTTYPKKPLLHFRSLTRKTDTAEQLQKGLLKKKRWLLYALIPLTFVASVPFFDPSLSFSDQPGMYVAMLLTLGVMSIIRELLTINQMNAEGQSHLDD